MVRAKTPRPVFNYLYALVLYIVRLKVSMNMRRLNLMVNLRGLAKPFGPSLCLLALVLTYNQEAPPTHFHSHLKAYHIEYMIYYLHERHLVNISLKTFIREVLFVNAMMDFYLGLFRIKRLTNFKIALTSMSVLREQDSFKNFRKKYT